MSYVLLSDIHSNRYALEAVLKEVASVAFDEILILGDLFGYYPWATEVYDMVSQLPCRIIRGNHDALLLQKAPPVPSPPYWTMARHNADQLTRTRPEALAWLSSLAPSMEFREGAIHFTLCHGTPADPENGRLYPDDLKDYPWMPGAGSILLLGHTHHPMVRATPTGGMIVNPGSVGQPRDGDPMPAWAVLDSKTREVRFRRTAYDFRAVMSELEDRNWDRRSILSLGKDYKGPLRSDTETTRRVQ
jgi:putative phosphoesterase